MKTDTHPTYFPEAKVVCVCGNTFTIGSTKKELAVEICSACHPFYTGNDKLMDVAGRVEKFKARTAFAKASSVKRAAAPKKDK
jgi:large subunit ribosomal protein L31